MVLSRQLLRKFKRKLERTLKQRKKLSKRPKPIRKPLRWVLPAHGKQDITVKLARIAAKPHPNVRSANWSKTRKTIA